MRIWTWAAVLTLAGPAVAGDTAAPAASEGLQPLAFLVGHCWRGEFSGRNQFDTHCFETVFDGKLIRDRHEVTGGKEVYRGESIYSWNADLGRVEYVYWNSLGDVTRGTMVPKDGALNFDNEAGKGADGHPLIFQTVWRPVGANSYQTASMENGAASTDRVVTYKRVD